MKKKLILLAVISCLMVACSNDEYADLRKMTVQDFLDNKEKMNEVNQKCNNREIKDEAQLKKQLIIIIMLGNVLVRL